MSESTPWWKTALRALYEALRVGRAAGWFRRKWGAAFGNDEKPGP